MEPEDGSGGGGSGGDEGGGGDINKQPQQRRLMTMQVHEQPHAPHPQQQTQRCPRCESLNTKFCYYNNYSLSQPRYFCKTCRRYWTQGGTLRNVPVGGGCRKGKSAKTSSSSVENCRSRLQSPPQEVVHTQPNSTTVIRAKDPSAAGSPSPAVPSISPYYQGGGYLSSLAAIQSLNPSQPFNQSLNGGGDALGSSNLALLSGFTAASLGSQPLHQLQCQIRPSQIYQMSDRERELESLYPAEQGLVQSSIDNSSPASRHDWPQSFINNANHRASDASLWSTISTTSIGDISESNNASAGSSYLIPNQWPDLRGP